MPATRMALLAMTAAALLGAAVAVEAVEGRPEPVREADTRSPLSPLAPGLEEAIFAAGCFWCVEKDFDTVPGVVETISGYTGGKTRNPTYETVARGRTGHVEAVLVRYDPRKVTYAQLLDHYWRHVDVTDGSGQFCDRGSAYRPVIFPRDPVQQTLAESGKAGLERSRRFGPSIAVAILPASAFTPAEDYHQDYYKKNPIRYRYYRTGCGRDARLRALWRNAPPE